MQRQLFRYETQQIRLSHDQVLHHFGKFKMQSVDEIATMILYMLINCLARALQQLTLTRELLKIYREEAE